MMNLSENTQKLMRYALEKAHPDTADVRYDERERLQDVELVRALLSAGVKITERDRKGNEPPVVFALFYCLSCMDDDTYADLMSKQTPSLSRSKLITIFRNCLVNTPGITRENCFDPLVTFELGRLKQNDRAKHRFAHEIDALLKHQDFESNFFSAKKGESSETSVFDEWKKSLEISIEPLNPQEDNSPIVDKGDTTAGLIVELVPSSPSPSPIAADETLAEKKEPENVGAVVAAVAEEVGEEVGEEVLRIPSVLPVPKTPSKEVKKARKPTRGEGDCAFHAALGGWNGRFYEVDNVAGKRKQVADAIKSRALYSELANYIKAAIIDLMINGQVLVGSEYPILKRRYEEYTARDNQRVERNWSTFEEALKADSDVMSWIGSQINQYIEAKASSMADRTREVLSNENNLKDRFRTLDNEDSCTEALREIIDSNRGFKAAYETYRTGLTTQPFGFELTQDLLKAYADFISTRRRYLLPCELQIVAYVFGITIEYYTSSKAVPEFYNPGQATTVSVCFIEEQRHYERMEDSIAPSSQTFGSSLSDLRPQSGRLPGESRDLGSVRKNLFRENGTTQAAIAHYYAFNNFEDVKLSVETFTDAIARYYDSANSQKAEALQYLIKFMFKLSHPKLKLNVRAPFSLTALQQTAHVSMNTVYLHLYTVLQAVLETVKDNRVDRRNSEEMKAAREAIKIAREILKWLASGEGPFESLNRMHDRMIRDLFRLRKASSAVNALAQLDRRNPWENAPSFVWGVLYKNGGDESRDEILEKRREWEVLSVAALKRIMCCHERGVTLTLEEKWLLVTAVTDYQEASDYLKKNPKVRRVHTKSPFYNAITLLALERGATGVELFSQLRQYCVDCESNVEANDPIAQNLKVKMENRFNQLLTKISKDLTPGSSPVNSPVKSPASKISPNTKTPLTLFCDSPEKTPDRQSLDLVAPFDKRWEKLDAIPELNKNQIIEIFQRFDAMCHLTAAGKRTELLLLLNKAFQQMEDLFKGEYNNNNRYWFYRSKDGVAPNHFEEFMRHIAPKSGLPPYTFALFCAFKAEAPATLYKYEYLFIRTHLHCLYSEDNRKELNTILHSCGTALADYVAPTTQSSPPNVSDSDDPSLISVQCVETKPVLSLIVPRLEIDVQALEYKSRRGTLTQKDIAPYRSLFINVQLNAHVSLKTRIQTLITNLNTKHTKNNHSIKR